MNRWLSGVVAVCVVAVTVSICISLHCLDVNLNKWGGGGGSSFAALNDTLQTINRACGTKDKNGLLLPCGTLAEVSKATVKMSDILVTTQKQEQDTAKVAEHTMASVDVVATHLSGTADALSGTANAVAGTSNAATKLLGTTDDTLAAAKPLLVASTSTVTSLNTTVSHVDSALVLWTPKVDRLLGSSADLVGNANGIAADARKVSDKATADYLAPKRWYSRLAGYSGDLLDIISAGARLTK